MADIPSRKSTIIAERFAVKDNTFKRAVTDNPRDLIEIEIGDSKQPDFKPQTKISRWDNEVNFSLRAEEHPEAVVRTEGKLIKYVTPDYEVHQYELDPGEIGEDGGLEFEWVLPKKPASNVLAATIQTKELDFFYQPALTQEEIDQGSERPENVVGSYAVYHKTKGGMNRADGMEYKTGKAFHIYRPKVTDKKGEETWAELNIDEENGVLSVTVPQEFLDKAVYPVIVDPTFGYTSAGVSVTEIAKNLNDESIRRGQTASLSQAGTLNSLHAYLYLDDSGSASVDTILYLNREDTGSWSHAQVASVEILNASYSSTTGSWFTFTAASESLIADDYVISYLGNGEDISTANMRLMSRYDSTGATAYAYTESATGSGSYTTVKESPWTEVGTSSNTKYSIYATYTTSKIQTLTDNFNDNSINATLWNDDTASETGGQMVVTANTSTGTYNGIASDGRYDLTSSYALIELVSAGDTSLSFTTYILELYNDTVDLYWGIEYGATDEIVAYKSPDSVSYTEKYRATYDSSVHKWFRIRESGGTTYWDTSVNGSVWTPRASDATGYDLTALNAFFGVANPGSGSTTVTFDNFNITQGINVSDSSTITEAVTVSIGSGLSTPAISVSDSASITEAVTVDVSDPQIGVTENITVTDSLPAYSQTEQATITESVGLLITSELNIAVSDSATITESVTAVVSDPQVSATENSSITESVAVSIIDASALAISVSDNASITETVVVDVSDPQITVLDNASITEAITVALVSSDLQINVSDSATITDSLPAYSYTEPATITESVGVSIETPAAPSDINITVSDSATITESVSVAISKPYAVRLSMLTDMHYGEAASGDYAAALTQHVTDINTYGPALVISNGDQFHQEDLAGGALATAVSAWKTRMENLNSDYLWVWGNHDQVDRGATETALTAESITYTEPRKYAIGAFDLIFIDGGAGDGSSVGTIDSADLTWLENNLDANRYSLVFCHYPVNTTSGLLELTNTADFMTTLQNNGKVLALFTGHDHNNLNQTYEYGTNVFGLRRSGGSWGATAGFSLLDLYIEDGVVYGNFKTVYSSTTEANQKSFVSDREMSVSDTATITEAVVVDVSDPQIVVSDSSTIIESVSVSISVLNTPQPTVSDTITVSESVSVDVSDLQVAVGDSATITESVGVSVSTLDIPQPSVSDTATISESVLVDVSDPQIAVSDTATITESVTLSVGGRYTRNDRLNLDIGSGLSIPLGPYRMPTWGTNARPANPTEGMLGYNVELNQIEIYKDGAWYKLEATPV